MGGRFWNTLRLMFYLNVFYFPTLKDFVGHYKLWNEVCLLLRRFDSEAGEAGELEARETGYEHARDHGKEKEERRNACKNSCRFLANFVVFLARYFSRVFKP